VHSSNLTVELLDAVVVLARHKRKRDDTRDVHLGAENVHVEAELLADGLDVLETFLVVGTRAADPDLNLVLDKTAGNFAKSADDALECGSDLRSDMSAYCSGDMILEFAYVGEVGNTATNEEDLALGVLRSAEHEVEDSASVVESLSLGWRTRVLAVVGKLASEASGRNSVGVDNGSTTTSDEGPDTTRAVEDSQLERSTSLCVHLRDVSLLLAELTTERCRELHWRASVDGDLAARRTERGNAESCWGAGDGPLHAALKLSGLVELGCQIEEVNLSSCDLLVGNDNERVDLEVGELAVDVNGVKAGDEVNEHVVDALGHLAEQALCDLLVAGVLAQVHRDQELLCLGINITDINTTLVVEENPVALKVRCQ